MRLLYLDNEGITKLINQYDRDTKALKEEIFQICWHMRGGIGINEAFQLSVEDRTIIADIIKQKLEITKESGLPYF